MFNKINKMKKLLLTIFAITVIVACDKDAYDNDATSINVVEHEENSVLNDNSFLIENLVSRISGEGFTLPTNKSSKGSVSTARTGTATATCVDARTDRSGNRLDGEVIFDGTNYFLLIRDEAEVGVGPFTPALTISFVKSADGATFQVYSNGSPVGGPKTLSSGFSALFEAPYTAFTFVESINEYGDYLADRSLSAAGLTCSTAPTEIPINIRDYYDFSAAPFPLTGTLATKKASAPAALLNYAATSEEAMTQTLMDAIRANQ